MARKTDLYTFRITSRAVVAGLGTAAAIALAGATPATARDGDDVARFLDCHGWKLTMPVSPDDKCANSRFPNSLNSLASPIADNGGVVMPAPQEPEEPEEPEEPGPSGGSGPGGSGPVEN